MCLGSTERWCIWGSSLKLQRFETGAIHAPLCFVFPRLSWLYSFLQRTAVPDEKKDSKYWARRKKNNDAAKRSRDIRRKKLDTELKVARDAITENQKLKQEVDVSASICSCFAPCTFYSRLLYYTVQVLKAEINSLRRLLKDANTTLSLWIRARQTAEPNVQLPPMLRSANVSYINFPVSTTS